MYLLIKGVLFCTVEIAVKNKHLLTISATPRCHGNQMAEFVDDPSVILTHEWLTEGKRKY